MSQFSLPRRKILAGSAALAAASVTGTLGALYSRRLVASGDPLRFAPVPSPYGPIAPVADASTGLELLQLPPGFSYSSFGWTGDPMADGQPTPDRHDGMAVMLAQGIGRGVGNGRGRARGLELVLIRNHERGVGATAIDAPGVYDGAEVSVVAPGARVTGGTTNLWFRDGQWLHARASLGGTLTNCAGGRTPWNTWLTCEEVTTNLTSDAGNRHGYVFEVNRDPERTSAVPIVGMGRFSHEAVAVDPLTSDVYQTEDNRNRAGLYRYRPFDRSGRPGSLEKGGVLQAAKVRGVVNADLNAPAIGDEFELQWVDILMPDADSAVNPFGAGLPGVGANEVLSGPFIQAWDAGALRMSRGEGAWYSDGSIFIVDTAAGIDSSGRRGRGEGAVWELDIASQRLRAIFASGDQLAANNPDNLTVSPRGGILLCEDGGLSQDAFGPGARLVGLSPEGESFYFAKNNVVLEDADLERAGKLVAPNDYRSSEFAGATWDPWGRTLFVNIQTPGITFAITGPWERGYL